MVKKSLTIVFLILACLTYAQDTIILKEITISDRYPLITLQPIDSIKLKHNIYQSLSDILQNEPGIYIKKYGLNNFETISIRGTQAHQNIVLWNNMPINSSLNGQQNINSLLYLSDKPIHIGYGSYGKQLLSGSFGGIVCLNSALDSLSASETILFTQYESLQNIASVLSNTCKISSIKMKNTVSLQHNQNKFSFENDAVLPVSEAENKNLNKIVEINNEDFLSLKNLTFTLSNRLNFSHIEIPPIMLAYYQAKHDEWTNHQEFQTVLNVKYLRQLSITAGVKYSMMEYFLDHSINEQSVTVLNSISKEPQFYLSGLFHKTINQAISSTFTINYHYLSGFFKNKISEQSFNKNQQRIELSQIIQKQWKKLSQKYLANLILYNQKMYFLPSIIHLFNVNNHLEISHSIGYNVRLPYLNELYFIPGGNQQLKPEKAFQTDLRLTYLYSTQNSFIKCSLSPHFSAYKDWILWQPTQFGYWEAKNIQRLDLYGSEFSITYQTQFLKIRNHHNLSYSLIFVNGKNEYYRFSHIPYIPTHSVSYFNQLSYQKFQLSNEFIVQTKRFVLPYDTNFSLNPYLIWNSYFTYQLKNIQFKIGIENLLNKSYQSIIYRPMPGRFLKCSILLKI